MSRLVPVRSLPLFAFANDGSIAWLRAAGPQIVAVDVKTGEVVREVDLDPAPFGISWSIERVGRFFVVKDDREIAAYDAERGSRLWKRTGPTRVAFAGEKGERHVTIAPGPAGVEILETDLATGEMTPRLTVPGSMRYIGAHGARSDDLLVFATDERDVWAVDTGAWSVVARHSFTGSHALPPVTTARGVHVAVIERRGFGAVTKIATLDGSSGALVSTSEVPGAAHALGTGKNGLLLDVKRAGGGVTERVAFRPHAPHIRLAIVKDVDVTVAVPRGLVPPRPPRPRVEIVPSPALRAERDEVLPGPRGSVEDDRSESARDGFLALLDVMRVRSAMLTRVATTFGDRPAEVVHMHALGLRFRDPRVRWSARAGRDPSLVDLAVHENGDTIATYYYPPARMSHLPVVRVDAATGQARWVADDFDAWLAGFLDGARATRPDLVAALLEALDLDPALPRPAPAAIPPPWFFEAHGARWSAADVEEALAAGDRAGAERMLVARGREGHAAEVKSQLAALYDAFGWGHHRAVVLETW